ncbi:lasso peptide biosynthesis B2 protein [Micromonospora okii]|uniref:lasso peptide biosynthesis B2 protein n=1 Tax=Micromonospora okii TaxID=1182970 RepID=UPI001E5C798D|nr:lasso peptide biosynthesis B2 protein [Micromonospora okii]
MADLPRALLLLLRRHGPRGLRVAAWAVRARRRVRRQLAHGGLDAVRPPAPPPGADTDRDVVLRTLRHAGANCLERSLVLQRWDAGRRVPRTLVIGVTAPSAGFHAHAWLDGDPDPHRDGMTELLRRPPPDGWLPARPSPPTAGRRGQARSTRP